VHRIHEAQPLARAALFHRSRNLGRDVDELATAGGLDPDLFPVRFHAFMIRIREEKATERLVFRYARGV
jgi:hypothetical protein